VLIAVKKLIINLVKTYLSSGCVQGCIIPFISRYKLSNSIPFGFGSAEFTGTHIPFVVVG